MPASTSKKTTRTTKKTTASKAAPKAKPTKKEPVRLLSGDNPQIPLGYGDGPVQDYISAVPGWKQGVCRRVDALVTSAVPRVKSMRPCRVSARWIAMSRTSTRSFTCCLRDSPGA